MNIKPIKTEKDYEKALARVEELWGADENTSEGEEFEVLFTLVEAYEQKHYPIPPPHPIEAIKFRLDQMGIKKSELKDYLVSVYNIFFLTRISRITLIFYVIIILVKFV